MRRNGFNLERVAYSNRIHSNNSADGCVSDHGANMLGAIALFFLVPVVCIGVYFYLDERRN